MIPKSPGFAGACLKSTKINLVSAKHVATLGIFIILELSKHSLTEVISVWRILIIPCQL